MVKRNRTIKNAKRLPEYKIWRGMKQRCNNKSQVGYPRYGGRGIRVCERWMNSFPNFLSDMGSRPSPAHTIERRETDGHYEPDNCYWATRKEQNNNTSRNRVLTFKGRKRTLVQICEELGIHPNVIYDRVERGLTFEEAIAAPGRTLYSLDGLSLNLHQWARRLGIKYSVLRWRLGRGMSFEEAIR